MTSWLQKKFRAHLKNSEKINVEIEQQEKHEKTFKEKKRKERETCNNITNIPNITSRNNYDNNNVNKQQTRTYTLNNNKKKINSFSLTDINQNSRNFVFLPTRE